MRSHTSNLTQRHKNGCEKDFYKIELYSKLSLKHHLNILRKQKEKYFLKNKIESEIKSGCVTPDQVSK